MKIGVAGSMQKTEEMLKARDELKKLGHEVFVSKFALQYIGKSDDEKEKLKLHHKNNEDAILEFWNQMQGADALLVVNVDKGGVKNYIGGNTLMEIGFAHVLGQKIFLLNTIPEIPFYKTEVEAVRPVIINGDFSKVR